MRARRRRGRTRTAGKAAAATTNGEPLDGVTPAVQPGRLEKARLIALNMAVNGAPREETERYLVENLNIPSPTALLTEVYGRTSTAG
jgi:hypothetical protein